LRVAAPHQRLRVRGQLEEAAPNMLMGPDGGGGLATVMFGDGGMARDGEWGLLVVRVMPWR